MTAHGDVPSARTAFQAQAVDFLDHAQLRAAIENAFPGAAAPRARAEFAKLATLTEREREVLEHAARACTRRSPPSSASARAPSRSTRRASWRSSACATSPSSCASPSARATTPALIEFFGEVRPRPRPGHDQLARDRLRPEGRPVAAREPPDLSRSRAGSSTTRRRFSSQETRQGRRSASPAFPQGPDGRGHHQPARDHHRLGPPDRRADRERDRVAGPAHRGAVRRAEGSGRREPGARAHRPRDRPVLQRHQDRLAARQRARRRARASAASSPSARSTPGSPGTSPATAPTSPTSRTPRARCSSTST